MIVLELIVKLLPFILASTSQRDCIHAKAAGFFHQAFLIIKHAESISDNELLFSVGTQALLLLEDLLRDDERSRFAL